MNPLYLGLFQASSDRFAFALRGHSGVVLTRFDFDARALRTALVSQPDGGVTVDLQSVPPGVREARESVFEWLDRDPGSFVAGGVMALESAADSWSMTALPNAEPGYHVALAFSYYPLRMNSSAERLVHLAYEDNPAAGQYPDPGWNLLPPAVAEQAAAIVFPSAPDAASGCAMLAAHPGLLTYLMGMGATFSLADIEFLARLRQDSSSHVAAMATGLRGEDRTWCYRVKLGARAIEQADLLALSYGRARARIAQGLRRRPPRPGLPAERLALREVNIERFAHHLAMLALCVEYRIGLWSRPINTPAEDDSEAQRTNRLGWAMAVAPETPQDDAADEDEWV